MRLRDAPVVAVEERQEILREVALVALAERAHDAEVEGDVAALRFALGADENVARVHVGVEEAVAEHLREEDLHARTGERGNVDPLLFEVFPLRNRDAVHPLHHHHPLRAKVPVHLGHDEQARAREVAPQLAGVRRLAQQIELLFQVMLEFRDHLLRLEAPRLGP